MTAPARARRRGLRLIASVGICLLAAGCASIPSSSPPQIIAESVPASEPSTGGDLRYDAIVPQPGERPEDIVRDFLRVGGSYERDNARARAYLTQAGNETWDNKSRVVVLEDAPYLDVQAGGATVQMSAQQRGRIESDGSYQPGRAPFPYTFRLKKVDGNWRIDNPPGGVLIEVGTFEAAFRPYNVYFLDSTRTRVVPDVRWYAAARDALPSLLVSAIEQGPSSWLGAAVRSDLEGATLQKNVEQESDRVKVYLDGLDDRYTLSAGGFAQLVWTLNQLGVGGVEVYVDGRLVQPRDAPGRSLQRLSDWRGFDPDGLSVSSPGYFIKNGAVWTTNDAPVAGPAGRAGYDATAVAVSTNARSLAVLRPVSGGGQRLFVGSAAGLRPTVVAGATLTPPTWGSAVDEVWTVRNGRDVVLTPVDGNATRVVVPALDDIGVIRALRLSRDGARVALVAGPPKHEQLHVGVVVRQNGSVRVERLRTLDVGESSVSDASWSDALTLVALVRAGQQDSGLYTVSIDGVRAGRLVASTGLPGPPAAVAAAPTLPLLTVAAGAIWRTPATDERWSRVTRRAGTESAPTYPG